MDAINAILTRRSIRRYTKESVPGEIITELLKAGMSAPSAGNEQPWHFFVITERSLLDAIPHAHPHAAMVKQASAAIVVCGDLHLDKFEGFWVQDCSAAVENILIAAYAKGLGAVWTGVHPQQDRTAALQKLLCLPGHIIPLSVIPLGWPAEEKPPSERYDPSRVHYNQW